MTEQEQARAEIAQREILEINIVSALASLVLKGPDSLSQEEGELLEILADGLRALAEGDS